MSGSDETTEELLDKLILDIKALVLLQGSTGELERKLKRELADSRDDDVKKFVDSLQAGPKPEAAKLLVISMGELILASLLVLTGTVVLIPVMVGVTTPQGLISYFANGLYGPLSNSPLGAYSGLIEFAAGALLILAAFYTLRQAALSLKQAGVAIKSGEG